jgi:subtilisin family serine protease
VTPVRAVEARAGRRTATRWCAVVALVSVAVISLLQPASGYVSQGAPAEAIRKVTPWLLQHADGGDAEFLVILAESADLGAAGALASRRDKGRFVRDALFARAQQTQAPLLEWLRSRRLAHRPFYIVNAIWVKASRSDMMAIAARPDVARIEGNPSIVNLEPVVAANRERSTSGDAPDAIEPGVSYVRAPEVWAQGFTGQGIVIASADTGVKWDHVALKDHYRGWNGALASHDYNWHDSIHSGGGSCGFDAALPCDDYGHGTHTIGTAVGAEGTTNQIGVAPGARFIACRNMDQGVGTPARYIECMEWFLAPYPVGGTPAQGDPTKAPDITSNSWGCPASEGCSADTLRSAIEAQRAAGIMTVVSAGNSGPSCSTVSDPPAFYDAAYTVGAFAAATGDIASFSSRGPVTIDGNGRIKPDISAPGVSVRSALSSGGYGTLSGTSMAAPHVAGVAALLWSARPALRHQIADTESVLDDAAADVPVPVSASSCTPVEFPNNVYGFGRLDAKAAVDLAGAWISAEPGAVNPPAVKTSGGQPVVLTGAFANLSAVAVGGIAASWSYTSGTRQVTITSPAHVVGSADITLIPISGANYTRANAIAFLPAAFTDDILVAGVTVVRAQHIIELRQAVDALRAVAVLGPAPWVDPVLAAVPIKAAHILELRAFLEEAAAALGYVAGNYTDAALGAGTTIKRVHVEELRQRLRNLSE